MPFSKSSAATWGAVSVLSLLFLSSAGAQEIAFDGFQKTVVTGLSAPVSLAVDSANNAYILESGRVLRVPSGCASSACWVPVVTGLLAASGVAIDSSGRVFVADYGHSRVLLIGGGLPPTAIATGYLATAVAVQANCDVYFTDAGASFVYRMSAAQIQLILNGNSGGAPELFVSTGLSNPTGLAVDAAGNLFVANAASPGYVAKIPAGCSGTLAACVKPLNLGLSTPSGLAVDAAGHLFVLDSLRGKIWEAQPDSVAQIAIQATGLNTPRGIAVDGAGNVWIADTANNRVVTVGNLGIVNVCPSAQSGPAPCSQTLTLRYTVNSFVNLQIVSVKAVAMGAENQDFSVVQNSCTGILFAGNHCRVTVKFAPVFAGLRSGALRITVSDGFSPNRVHDTLLSGVGAAPQLAFGFGAQSPLGSGWKEPHALAVDGNGNVYVTDFDDNRVVKIPAGGGAQTSVGTGLKFPSGVAVDGAGNVFIADFGNSRVVRVSTLGTQTNVGTGVGYAHGVTVDGAGNVYIADTGNNRVLKVPVNGGAQTVIGSGLSHPAGVAVDAAGNVFISDSGNFRIVKVPAGGGPQITLQDTGVPLPIGIAVDGAGNLYVASQGRQGVLQIPPDGSPQYLIEYFPGPGGVALDAAGNLFVSVGHDGIASVTKVQRSAPPTLVFPTPTGMGSYDTQDGPQTTFLQNIGTQPLVFTNPQSGTNPSYPANFPVSSADPKLCTSAAPLLPGAICEVSAQFLPNASGTNTGAITLVDNALNAVDATQQILLTGTGFGAPVITKNFGALTLAVTTTTSLNFTITNPNSGAALHGIAFTDSLPFGIAIAPTPNLFNTCGGVATAVPGSGVVALSGADLPALAQCIVSVSVVGTSPVQVDNSVQVTSTDGGTGNTATATIYIVAPPANSTPPPVLTKRFGASSIPFGGVTTLTFTIDNPNQTKALTGIAFQDNLPAGLTLATPVSASSNCGGTLSASNGATSTSLAGASLAAQASCTISMKVTGIHAGTQLNTTSPISATESGPGSTSNIAAITVLPIPANTDLRVTPGLQQYGGLVKLTASILPGQRPVQNAATGVTFSIAGTSLGSAALVSVGQGLSGELTVPVALPAGDYKVTAQFTGVHADYAPANAVATLRVR